jgi:hypothetical protein
LNDPPAEAGTPNDVVNCNRRGLFREASGVRLIYRRFCHSIVRDTAPAPESGAEDSVKKKTAGMGPAVLLVASRSAELTINSGL